MRRMFAAVAFTAAATLAAVPAMSAENGTTLGGGSDTQTKGGGNKTSGGAEKGGSASKDTGRTDQGSGTTLGGGQKDTK